MDARTPSQEAPESRLSLFSLPVHGSLIVALSTTIIAELSSGTGDPLLKMAVLFRELARRLTTSTLQKLSQGRPDGKRGKIEIPMAKKQANNGETTAKLGFEAKLWAAADALRNNMDAAEYKHVVLGLIFLKYISDAFEAKHAELEGKRKDGADPEDPDEYRAFGIFWVPKEARWTYLKADAPQPTIGKIVDDAMTAIERDNPSLKGVLPKEYARPGLDKQRLGRLINLVSDIALGSPADRVKDTLGRVYEYFLARFASAEGKSGGQFYTPSYVVRVLVEMLAPYKGRVYDPCCGSGGMFVQSEKFIEAHSG